VMRPDEPVWLDADATRLAQVLSNLLNNAAKYTPEGGRISVEVHRTGDAAEVRVRDSGIGIRADVLPRVFQMFTQADSSHDRSHGGLGIGLAISRRLVELHGGTLTAASDGPGRGSEFTVRLPVAAGPAPAAPPSANGVATRPLRVLVADDNRDSAESLAVLLRLAGHEVHTAFDGPRAVELAAARPEVALLDIGMPGMSGHEVARRLRARPESADCVLVAMTGWGQDDDRRRSKEAGFDHHLVKPVDLPALNDLLAQVASGRASAGAG
jgi:CheY-like chemotaxis protein